MAKKKSPEKDNSERWLLTYSDLMNLLLILFIILYCSSQLNQSKAEQVAQSMRTGFSGYVQEGGGSGGHGGEGGESGGSTGGASSTEVSGISKQGKNGVSGGADSYWTQETKKYGNFYQDIVGLIKKDDLQEKVDVTLDDRGIVISFRDTALFGSGSADLSDSAVQVMTSIGNLLNGIPYSYILVEGHTDTDPIHTAQYIDNMDLSSQRADNVWRVLVSCGIPQGKMAAIGYGESRPVAPNDTPENKAKNRRVVVTILRSEIDSSQQIAGGVEMNTGIGSSTDKSSYFGSTSSASSGTPANIPSYPTGAASHGTAPR